MLPNGWAQEGLPHYDRLFDPASSRFLLSEDVPGLTEFLLIEEEAINTDKFFTLQV